MKIPFVGLFLFCFFMVKGQGYQWPKSSPLQQKVNAKAMQQALTYLESKSGQNGLQGTVIVRNGQIIFAGDSLSKTGNLYSCSKSITSMVLGLLIADGKCTLHSKAAQWEPLLAEHYPKVTLRHFVTMTSGYNAVGNSRWNEPSTDWSWTPYLPNIPLSEPGASYAYWDEAMIMFGRVLTRIAQKPLQEYLTEKLTNNMQLGLWTWGTEGSVDGITINNGCTGVHLNPLQLAQLGQLYLQKGKWGNKQLIPEQWVAASTRVQVPKTTPITNTDRANVKGSGSYGYNFWLSNKSGQSPMPNSPQNTYYMSGFNHNVCCVIPEWNMVIVRMGTDGNPLPAKHIVWDQFLKLMGQAVQ
jgi:CubicO group peptidase (beta-lactamase class C family)